MSRPTTHADNPKRKPYKPLRTFPAVAVRQDEVAALLRVCSRRSASGRRAAGLLAVLFGAGLRIAEACALEVPDVDLSRSEIHVRHGKGDKSRTVGIAPQYAAVLEVWLTLRRQLGFPPKSGPIFCTNKGLHRGSPITPKYARELLHRLGRKAGLNRRVHPHALRHGHADYLNRAGIDIVSISGQLGHASVAVTARYVAHISPAERIAKVNAAWKPDEERPAA